MTSLRAVAANRTTELGRLKGMARSDQHAGNASFPEALDGAAKADEMSPNSKSRSDPKFETSSSETRSEPTGPRTRSAQGTGEESPTDAAQQTSLEDQFLSAESPVAAQTAGSVSAEQLEPGSDRSSTSPDANAPSMPQAEIGDDDPRHRQIHRSSQETGTADAGVAVAIIHATGLRPPRLSTAGPAVDRERNALAAVSLPTSGAPSLDLPGGRPGSETPGDSSVESVSSIPFSQSQGSVPDDADTIAGAHLAAISPAARAVDSVLRETAGISPASASAIDPGPDPLRQVPAIPASSAPDAVEPVSRKPSASNPGTIFSGIDSDPDTLRRVPAMAASPLLEGGIPASDPSAERTRANPHSVSSTRLMASAPNPLAGNTDLAGLPVDGSAPASPSNPQPVGLADQLAHHVMTSIDNGGREVLLQLHPPELGDLTVRVLVSGRDVSAWFASQQIPVQQAISQAIGQLHTDLGNAGYNLSGAWVGADASGSREWEDRSLARSRATADRSSSQGSPAPPTPSAASGVSIYV
jgi:Flagellar hook-length control protein FliK